MDPDTEKLYTKEEVAEMDAAARKKLIWISRAEYQEMQKIEEGKRMKALSKMRAKEQKAKKKKRKAQRQARKKNR